MTIHLALLIWTVAGAVAFGIGILTAKRDPDDPSLVSHDDLTQ